jgi:hypothetical protein
VTLAHFLEAYTAVWMLSFAYMCVESYRKKTINEIVGKFEESMGSGGENSNLAADYENDTQKIRTKLGFYMPMIVIAFLFALSSLWPLAVAFRLYGALRLHRHDDHEDE